jgi:hypothetical protein
MLLTIFYCDGIFGCYKRPCDSDRLEGMRWEVSFAGVKLAPFAGVHDLAGIGDHGAVGQ